MTATNSICTCGSPTTKPLAYWHSIHKGETSFLSRKCDESNSYDGLSVDDCRKRGGC